MPSAPSSGTSSSSTPGALEGLRVLDFSTVVMGPFATQILGDLGADVIKVEPPTGDLSRRTHPQVHEGMGVLALNVNRNKRSVALDLKSEAGLEAFLDLVRTADVLVTNMRPGALTRLGVGYDELAAVNPRLVYARAQGFRSDSDRADHAAYDEIVQAASGVADLMRRATGTPTYVPTIMADKVCALTLAYSVLAAVIHQRATGEGQEVEVPMTDTMLAFTLVEHLSGHTFEPSRGAIGFNRSMVPDHRAVATADGWACILPYNARNIADFFTAAGRPEVATDPRFADPGALATHYGELYALVAQVAPERTTAAWQELCAAHSIPFAPVLELDDAETDPYVVGGGLLDVREHPTEGAYRSIGFPVRLSRTPGTVRSDCPQIGGDTEEVLREIGRSDAQIAALIASGAAARPRPVTAPRAASTPEV